MPRRVSYRRRSGKASPYRHGHPAGANAVPSPPPGPRLQGGAGIPAVPGAAFCASSPPARRVAFRMGRPWIIPACGVRKSRGPCRLARASTRRPAAVGRSTSRSSRSRKTSPPAPPHRCRRRHGARWRRAQIPATRQHPRCPLAATPQLVICTRAREKSPRANAFLFIVMTMLSTSPHCQPIRSLEGSSSSVTSSPSSNSWT